MAEITENSKSKVEQKLSNTAEASLKINEEIFKKSVIYENVKQDVIITTSDKIKLILEEFQNNVKAKSDWVTPAGILVTVLATLVTTDFKKFLNIEANVWKSLYIISGIVCFVYCIINVCKAISSRNKCTIEYVINKLTLKDNSDDKEY